MTVVGSKCLLIKLTMWETHLRSGFMIAYLDLFGNILIVLNMVFAMTRVQDLKCYLRSSINDVDCFGTLQPIALLWLEKMNRIV